MSPRPSPIRFVISVFRTCCYNASVNKSIAIAIDGPDGSGKTTQLELLREHLESKGEKVHATRASGGTPIGEQLRRVSLSHNKRPAATDVFISMAMFAALAEDLKARKARGEIVLVDRSPLAMIAYNAFGGQLPETSSNKLKPTLQSVMEAAADSCEAWGIDLLLFFDAPQDVLDKRRKKRGEGDYFENQTADYHRRVRAGYEAGLEYLTGRGLDMKVFEIDASSSIGEIRRVIASELDKL